MSYSHLLQRMKKTLRLQLLICWLWNLNQKKLDSRHMSCWSLTSSPFVEEAESMPLWKEMITGMIGKADEKERSVPRDMEFMLMLFFSRDPSIINNIRNNSVGSENWCFKTIERYIFLIYRGSCYRGTLTTIIFIVFGGTFTLLVIFLPSYDVAFHEHSYEKETY